MESLDPRQQAILEEKVVSVLKKATTKGASGAMASAWCDIGLSTMVRLGEVEAIEHHRDQGLTLTVYLGKQQGSASTTDLSPQALEEVVEAACAIARHTQPDPCHRLPDPELLAQNIPDLDLDHPWTSLSPERAIELARIAEEAAFAVDRRIKRSEGAELTSYHGVHVLGNTLGFLHGYPSSRHTLSCCVVAEADGQMERDYWWTTARDPADLDPPEVVGRKAGERTVRRLGARSLKAQKVPVLFAPEMARSLFGHFLTAIQGSALYRKASFLVDSLGKPVFPEWITIREEPHIPKGVASAPYDAEGVATKPATIVSSGRVAKYLLSTYTACKLGLKTTGNAGGVHNAIVQPTVTKNLEAFMGEIERGLLVTELLGSGVNLITGDYSRGAFGFWIERGEIQYPVSEITIAGNLQEIFKRIVAVGDDLDRRGALQVGSVLVEEMTVAGAKDAAGL